MTCKSKQLSLAALAGAASLGLVSYGNAAVTIVGTDTGSVTYNNGTYDVIDFNLTGLSGGDALGNPSSTAGDLADPGLNAITGTFTATGSIPNGLGVPGVTTTSNKAYWEKFAYTGGTAVPSGYGASYVNLNGAVASSFTRSNTGSGTVTGTTPTTITGNSTSFTGTWDSTATAIELSTGPNPNPLVAQILVLHGDGVSFTGQYAADASATVFPTTFAYNASGGGSSTNKIIALAPSVLAGTAPNGYGNSGPQGTLTSYGGQSNTVAPASNVSGYVNLVGTNNGYVLLKLALNGTVLVPGDPNDTTIANDINASNPVGAVAIPLTGSPLSQYAAEGFDVAVPLGSNNVSTFAYDFSSSGSDTTDPGLAGVSVTAIAAVPEPATAAGVILGAAGLLLGRRKTKVVSA